MAAKAKNHALDQDRAINAVLALLVADREERLAGDGAESRKSEVVLASVGLTANEIAPLVGKSTDAVTKTIQRARQPKKSSARTKKG
jgi:DNA-directed RNA polymerase specialized sigma24 family protein